MNMTYRSTRGPQFSTGARPPDTPYIRGFEARLCAGAGACAGTIAVGAPAD